MFLKNFNLVVFTLIFVTKYVCGLPMTEYKVSFENSQNADEKKVYDKIKSEILENDIEKRLNEYLEWYYETYINSNEKEIGINDGNKYDEEKNVENEDIYERMQSDQAAPYNFAPISPLHVNLSMINFTKLSDDNQTDVEYIRTMRNRTKDTWIQILKDNILRQVGRMNSSSSKPNHGMDLTGLNISQFMPGLQIPNDAIVDDEFVTEKIRSYYPSCDLPKNTEQELWKDENTMNLYFNVEHPDSNSANIATATLRLYRLPSGNGSNGNSDVSCENSSGVEDQLMRISIYWYTKSLKRQRVKRRLSDSKVIGPNAKWVELSVLPATKAWVKGKNQGLAILVEDQEGTVLKAEKYFKGASCMVGTSTPKPIPTVVVDAARWANELESINGSLGRNSTAAFYNHVSLLPTVDICTLEFPQNSTYDISNIRKNGCDFRKIHYQSQKLMQTEMLSELPSSRHIRHQKQHMHELNDPRSRIIGQKLIITNEELRNYNARLANGSFPNINR